MAKRLRTKAKLLKQVKAKCRFQEAYSQLSTEKEISLPPREPFSD